MSGPWNRDNERGKTSEKRTSIGIRSAGIPSAAGGGATAVGPPAETVRSRAGGKPVDPGRDSGGVRGGHGPCDRGRDGVRSVSLRRRDPAGADQSAALFQTCGPDRVSSEHRPVSAVRVPGALVLQPDVRGRPGGSGRPGPFAAGGAQPAAEQPEHRCG